MLQTLAEIVIVWNSPSGNATLEPPPELDSFNSSVPIRYRLMNSNSLNSRFLPDPLLTTRAVLSLNDDVLAPCTALDNMFVEWQHHTDRIVGFFPRLLHVKPTAYTLPLSAGQPYNLILTNGAFLDATRAFELYWHQNNTAARDIVDEMLNCEDILMNLVWANAAGLGQKSSVLFSTPHCFVEGGRLSSGTGISLKPGHLESRKRCAERFEALQMEMPPSEIMHDKYPTVQDLRPNALYQGGSVVASLCK